MIAEKLARFINNESRGGYIDYTPDHTRKLLDHFGNPHRLTPSIHVGGTNGKGSVAHMLHAIFNRAGYTVGLYTSPHLLEINERIIVGDRAIPDSTLESYIDEIIRYADSDEGLNPTYFDILTVCAFRYFHDRRVDAAIIEVGLGGRLDSTNVITPLCSILTEISSDHTDVLGGSLAAITREKAGIIKPNIPVITSNRDREILGILRGQSEERGARLLAIDTDFAALNTTGLERGHRFDYQPSSGSNEGIPDIEVNHPLEKQIDNACLAVTAAIIARAGFQRLDDSAIRSALHTLRLPGRFETLATDPLIIFDPAHNEAALAEMISLLSRKHAGRDVTLVLMLMRDKNIAAILELIRARRLPALYFASPDERCHIPVRDDSEPVFLEIFENDESMLHRALDHRISPDSLFFFTGSFRLYRTARNYAARHTARRLDPSTITI